MRLYLVQHGKAMAKDQDPDRPLTVKGKEDSAKIAKFLNTAGISIDAIWHSTKTRAIETAQILAKELSPKEGTWQLIFEVTPDLLR
ncbi:MAG: histidine phosphatase family protein [Candidatus Tantalella remota]|nr:histidine phosphatase family protein [Candidatus Tantalella remota]